MMFIVGDDTFRADARSVLILNQSMLEAASHRPPRRARCERDAGDVVGEVKPDQRGVALECPTHHHVYAEVVEGEKRRLVFLSNYSKQG